MSEMGGFKREGWFVLMSDPDVMGAWALKYTLKQGGGEKVS